MTIDPTTVTAGMRDESKPTREVTVLGQGRFLRLVNEDGWEFAERSRGNGVVAVVAVTDDERLILTEQYRPAVKVPVIDLPAGLAGDTDDFDGEPLQAAAARELEEETGYTAQLWSELTTFPTSPGLSSETVTLFFAEQLYRTSDGGGDAGEAIAVRLVPLQELPNWLQKQTEASCLIDPKVYAGLWLRNLRMSKI